MDDKYLIVILVLAILFGASRLPMLGRNFGQGIREFKKGIAQSTQDEPAAAAPMPTSISTSLQPARWQGGRAASRSSLVHGTRAAVRLW